MNPVKKERLPRTMPRKRNKGKVRKAESGVRATAQAEADLYSRWATVAHVSERDEGVGCSHGGPIIPAPGHAVSRFMNALLGYEYKMAALKTPYHIADSLAFTFKQHPEVWDDATLRNTARGIILTIGTNLALMLDVDFYPKAKELAYSILLLEKYDVDGGFGAAAFKSSAAIRDITGGAGGGVREIICFYLKRITCPCLKAAFATVKEVVPEKTGFCHNCEQEKERRSLMLCGRCKIMQYCCRECQVEHWPTRKAYCDNAMRCYVQYLTDRG